MTRSNNLASQRSLREHIVFTAVLGVALVGGVGGWAATASLSSAVLGQAVVVIDDNAKKIQHLSGGIVSELAAREGAHVQAGDVLLRLDATSLSANLAIVNSSLAQLYVRRARLQSERLGDETFQVPDLRKYGIDPVASHNLIEGEIHLFTTRRASISGMRMQLQERQGQLEQEISGASIQIKAIEEALELIDEELGAISSLYAKKLVTMQRVNALKRQRVELDGDRGERIAARAQAQGRISEINLQIIQLDEDRSAENAKELAELEAKVAENEERRVSLRDELTRLDVRAPMDGRIFQLAIHTIGGVVTPGEPLMLLAPDTKQLTVEAKISPSNIDQVHVGQEVDIRFSAFDQRSTPQIEGEVISVSPDVVTEQRTGAMYYPVRVRPNSESLPQLGGKDLYPGMPAEVFIRIADRKVISYLMKPLADQIQHTFREE